MFSELGRRVAAKPGLDTEQWTPDIDTSIREPRATAAIPGARIRYLAEIAEQGRGINTWIDEQAEAASRAQHVYESLKLLDDPALPKELEAYPAEALTQDGDRSLLVLRQRYQEALGELTSDSLSLLREWPSRKAGVRSEHYTYKVRGREITGDNYRESLSHQKIPKIAAPDFTDWGQLLIFLGKENLPGAYPYTGGVYPYRRLVRRRGHARAHQPAIPLPVAGAARGEVVDRVRLGDAVRRRPARAPGHLRQGRQFRRLDRDRRRHEEALLGLRPVCADDVGVDDDQWPGADDARVLHEYGGRPAGRKASR